VSVDPIEVVAGDGRARLLDQPLPVPGQRRKSAPRGRCSGRTGRRRCSAAGAVGIAGLAGAWCARHAVAVLAVTRPGPAPEAEAEPPGLCKVPIRRPTPGTSLEALSGDDELRQMVSVLTGAGVLTVAGLAAQAAEREAPAASRTAGGQRELVELLRARHLRDIEAEQDAAVPTVPIPPGQAPQASPGAGELVFSTQTRGPCRYCHHPAWTGDRHGPVHPCCGYWARRAPGRPCPACSVARSARPGRPYEDRPESERPRVFPAQMSCSACAHSWLTYERPGAVRCCPSCRHPGVIPPPPKGTS